MVWTSSTSMFGAPKTSIDMIEQAKDELQMLESQHPNKFEYLKLELRSFIALLQSHNSVSTTTPSSSSASATTQESSSNRKRKKGSLGIEQPKKKKLQKVVLDSEGCTRSRIDVVMERAKACLLKIQRFKTSNL